MPCQSNPANNGFRCDGFAAGFCRNCPDTVDRIDQDGGFPGGFVTSVIGDACAPASRGFRCLGFAAGFCRDCSQTLRYRVSRYRSLEDKQ